MKQLFINYVFINHVFLQSYFACMDICNESGACGQENNPQAYLFWELNWRWEKQRDNKTCDKNSFDSNNKILYYITWVFLRSCND